jgi:predicted ATP-binding protein involved in virulence
VILKNLSLTNYRGFEQLEIDFHPQVNVIAGINGVGKSSILHALRALFSRALSDVAIERFPAVSLSDDDVQTGSLSLGIAATFSIQKSDIQSSIQRTRTDEQQRAEWTQKLEDAEGELRQARQAGNSSEAVLARFSADRYRNLLGQHGDRYSLAIKNLKLEATQNDGIDHVAIATRERLRDFRKEENQPLVVYYSPLRHIFSRVRTLPDGEPLGVEKAFESALEETEVSFRYFMHWFRWLEQADNKATKRKRNALAKALREAVTAFIPEFKNLRIDLTTRPRLIVDKNGVALELGQLSDGERGLLALVFDLTRRLALANPTLSDPLAKGKAIVLIDELELHLHPSWQRDVLHRLQETFQNCQFIITTHSPQVLGEVAAESVRFLARDEEGRIVPWTPQQALGLDSNRVLEELMGVRSRNAKTDEQLLELSRVIDAEDFDAARALIVEMQKTLGRDDPEITRAETLMSFLEGSE